MSTAAESTPAEESIPPRPPTRIVVNELKMRFETPTAAGDTTDAKSAPSTNRSRDRVTQPPGSTVSSIFVNSYRSRFDRNPSPTSPTVRQSTLVNEPRLDRITRYSTLQRNASHHYNALEAPHSLLNRSDCQGIPAYNCSTLGRVGTLPRSQRNPDKYMSLQRPARKENGGLYGIGVAPKQPKVEPVQIDIALEKDDEPVSYSPTPESPSKKEAPSELFERHHQVALFRPRDNESLSGPMVSRSTYERVLQQMRARSEIEEQQQSREGRASESDSAIESRQTNTENSTPLHAPETADGNARAKHPNSMVVTEVHHQGYLISRKNEAADGAAAPGQYSVVRSYERNENSLLNTLERTAPKNIPPGMQVSSGLTLDADKQVVRAEQGVVEESVGQQRTTPAESGPQAAVEKSKKKPKKSLARRILEFLHIKKRKDKKESSKSKKQESEAAVSGVQETQTLPRTGNKGSRDKFKKKDEESDEDRAARFGTVPRVQKAKSETPAPLADKQSSPNPTPTTTTISTTTTAAAAAQSNGKPREPELRELKPQVTREVISEHTSRVVDSTTPGTTTISVTIERTTRERKLLEELESESEPEPAPSANANMSVAVHAIGSPAPFPGSLLAEKQKLEVETEKQPLPLPLPLPSPVQVQVQVQPAEGVSTSQTLQSGVSTTSAVSSEEPATVLSASLSLPPLSEEPSGQQAPTAGADAGPEAHDVVDARESASAMAEIETFRQLIEERQAQADADADALGDTVRPETSTRVECAQPVAVADEEVDESAQVATESTQVHSAPPISDGNAPQVEMVQSATAQDDADLSVPTNVEPEPEPLPEDKSAVPESTRQAEPAVVVAEPSSDEAKPVAAEPDSSVEAHETTEEAAPPAPSEPQATETVPEPQSEPVTQTSEPTPASVDAETPAETTTHEDANAAAAAPPSEATEPTSSGTQ